MVLTEKTTQRAITDYLSFRKKLWWRNNTGAHANEYKGKRYYVRYGETGSPDVYVLDMGVLYGIEVKDVKGKLSEAQVSFRERFEKAGGRYILAKSLDDVVTRL